MQREFVSQSLSELAFDFFFWFSRFEAALKENNFLKSRKVGEKAKPDWDLFSAAFASKYVLTVCAKRLISMAPETQIVAGTEGGLDWIVTKTTWCKSDLQRITFLLRTVRNNLFHGAKHGSATWDNPERTADVLQTALLALNEIASLSGLAPDYERKY